MSNAILDLGETPVAVNEVAKSHGAHVATVSRWCLHGVLTRAGERLRLEHYRRGSRLFTSHEAVKRFFAGLTDMPTQATPTPTPADRRKSAEAADRELAKLGA